MSCNIRARINTTNIKAQINASFGGAITCNPGTVNIVNTEDTLLYSKSVTSGGTAEQVIADQTAKVSGMNEVVSFPANTEGVIIAAGPYKTGVTTIYVSQDDGSTQYGRGVSWNVLNDINEYGNTDRFVWMTDSIIHDCATGLIWYDDIYPQDTYLNYVSIGNSLNIDGYTGWRLPSIKEAETLINYESQGLNQAPFFYNSAVSGFIGLVTSTTFRNNGATNAIAVIAISNLDTSPTITGRSKTNNTGGNSIKRAFFCRYKHM